MSGYRGPKGPAWSTEEYGFCLDAIIDGKDAKNIAIEITRKFKHRFTRSSILGKINRDFGGIEQLLVNIVKAWPNEPRAEKIKALLLKKFGRKV
ncbi:MAG: hypothetical protein KGL39_49280 [Patescibacteria group bacterium]|nr:hypothetical protein [Patescibacteria group bacterium]